MDRYIDISDMLYVICMCIHVYTYIYIYMYTYMIVIIEIVIVNPNEEVPGLVILYRHMNSYMIITSVNVRVLT